MDIRLKRHSFVTTLLGFFFGFLSNSCYAAPSEIDLSVWANEAIVATYTFSASNFLDRQKQIAKYFSSQGWINYNKALVASKLQDSVQKNNYEVSAVALLPPVIKTIVKTNEWEATMPLLVLYKNKEYQQKQTLSVVITFMPAKENEGVRGLVLTSFTTTVTTPACRCERPNAINIYV